MQPRGPALEHRQRPAGDSGCSSSGKQTPSAATVWSKMLRLFLSHLLGLCLLLILCAREIPAQKTAVLRVCGREYVRLQIQICGSVRWGKRNHQYHRESRESRQIPSALLGEFFGPRRSLLPIGCSGCQSTVLRTPALAVRNTVASRA